MTEHDVDDPDACPICGTVLILRDGVLYCEICDLVYAADEKADPE